ncbi:MAG TPA: acyltransferase, partial [Intrasporangium sp.]|uniref:acyltransferase family protein n=1 Tax=Intrasporangium sp. TaxID=1925024 RepID=UPI002B461989
LKVVLVAGVIVAHTTMAWTGVGNWVFRETPVREPLLTLLTVVAALGALFGMSLFFLIAGYFTPRSLERKGARRFILDRVVRLLVPMLAFVVLLSPPIEYVDPDNAGWTDGFWAFVPEIWWPPAPGPTWFLGVLFLFSVAYAGLRTWRPRPEPVPRPLRPSQLAVLALAIAGMSFLIRTETPLGEELWRLALAQAPGWVVGFALGVLAAERGWLPLGAGLGRRMRWIAWVGMSASVAIMGLAGVSGMDLALFLGHGTWQSGVLSVVEGVILVTVPLWLVDLFWRRFDEQPGRFGWVLRRSAFGAFLVHQGGLVALVLGVRLLPWPPEAAYLTVSALGVGISFALGWFLTRLPGVSRIV